MKSIYNLTKNELIDYLIDIGEKKYRALQIFDWLYIKRVKSFDDMINLNRDLINKLKQKFIIDCLSVSNKQIDKEVVKYLFELKDGEKIESVLMFHNYGNSLCVSTQIGCNMGCVFCESGRLKKVRNLESSEMVNQILTIENDLNKRISHIVLMGIGEPFDNYNNVIKFINIINDQNGINIGARHITISTCGLIPKIKQFIQENLQVNLAISLHAPNNELRNKLVPINKVYNIDDLMLCIKEYIKKTNRRVTFEYIMIDGLNDDKKLAIELSELLRGINCYVNLIPYNETSNSNFKRSKKVNLMAFYDILKKNNINVTIRKEFGQKISAACGQLRAIDKGE